VISHRYWQQALSAEPAVIGRTLTISGTLFTVVGVMPASFYGVELNEEMPDMWVPLNMQQRVMQQLQGSLLEPNGMFWLHMIARRKPDVNVAQAQAWTTPRLQHFFADREGTHVSELRRREIASSYVPLLPIGAGVSHLRADYEAPLAVLMGVVVLVLLIACANLANFLLAKAAAREREFTTRLALGSSRTRIVRQILTETLLLACTGGAIGLLLAFAGTLVGSVLIIALVTVMAALFAGAARDDSRSGSGPPLRVGTEQLRGGAMAVRVVMAAHVHRN
jgi:hypothetical protein